METGSREKLIEVLKTFRTAMLVTATPDGTLRSRPMALLQVEPSADLWFMTSAKTGKIDEIAAQARVNVALQQDAAFASVTGRASVHRDRAKIHELWTEHAKVYFPKGKDDPDIVLIKVSAEEGEYWDQDGLEGIKYLFEAGNAYVPGTKRPEAADPEQHGSVNLNRAVQH
jgi:general stress protein 26